MSKIKKIVIIAILIIVLGLLGAKIAFELVWNGIILLNNPSRKTYPVRGVDVSSYQGEIDWEVLSSHNISFAFIKATEGSSFVDKRFAYNYQQAQKTHLSIGAYHFFSFDSAGTTQAENFISTVQPYKGMLPPVIDVEFYGNHVYTPPSRENVEKELCDMLNALESYYGLKPILYATEQTYNAYLAEGYADYDIWIRNVMTKPKVSDNRAWTFWQFTNRGKLDGYNGQEKFIDINVFCSSEEEFAQYPRYGVK